MGVRGKLVLAVLGAGAVLLPLPVGAGASLPRRTGRSACPGWGRPALSPDPRAHALRVFGIQFRQDPGRMASAADYTRAIDCAVRREVLPHLAHHRPNLIVFDEDVGLETLAIGPRGARARALLRSGDPSCHGEALCPILHTLAALDEGYGHALSYLEPRFPQLKNELGRSFVAGSDEFVRAFMTTMSDIARRDHVYVIASNTQPRVRPSRTRAAITALADPGARRPPFVYLPTSGVAYDQTFVWGPRVVHRRRPGPFANLLDDNYKVPLTTFEQELGFATGPSGGPAARANLRPVQIPGTKARLGLATSLPAFEYGPTSSSPCANVSVTYMRCLSRLGANVLIQADANDGEWPGTSTGEPWQPLDWMGSAYRAVSDPTVHFDYAVNPFMVGNLADVPFDGQSAILVRGRRGRGCAYVGDRRFVPGQDNSAFRRYTGRKAQFLVLAPWVIPDTSRARLRRVGDQLANGIRGRRYVQTAVIADLSFPSRRRRAGCRMAGR